MQTPRPEKETPRPAATGQGARLAKAGKTAEGEAAMGEHSKEVESAFPHFIDSNGMLMEIGSALSSLSAAIGLVKSAVDARDEAKINAALTDINKKHLDLSMAALHLAEALSACQTAKSDLERENRDLAGKTDERKRYVLHELAPGRFAYRFAPVSDSPEPEHYLCQLCYDQSVKSVLHITKDSMLGTCYQCLHEKEHTFYA